MVAVMVNGGADAPASKTGTFNLASLKLQHDYMNLTIRTIDSGVLPLRFRHQRTRIERLQCQFGKLATQLEIALEVLCFVAGLDHVESDEGARAPQEVQAIRIDKFRGRDGIFDIVDTCAVDVCAVELNVFGHGHGEEGGHQELEERPFRHHCRVKECLALPSRTATAGHLSHSVILINRRNQSFYDADAEIIRRCGQQLGN